MNGESRLSEALAANEAILEYIVSLSPHDFNRLRNPLLRKVMPPRITLRRIAAMVGMPEQELVSKINELAGLPSETVPTDDINRSPLPMRSSEKPDWLATSDSESIKWVDVTPIDAEHGDPMPPINIAINTCKPGTIIGIKHMWEPQPFYDIWHSRGFEFWAEQINPDLWHVYVHRP